MAVATLSPPTPRSDTAGASAEARRQAMIDSQLRPSDVIEPRLLAAIRTVDREAHVPAGRAAMAYADRAIPLGDGRALNAPLTTARLIADLNPRSGDRLLLIGGATGYAAAILRAMGVDVTMVEESQALLAIARGALDHSGSSSVTIVDGPLNAGAPAHAPFDAMMIDGAVETLPLELLHQLADGAPIVSGIADGSVSRIGRAVWTMGASGVALLPFADIECVALPGFAAPAGFRF